MCLSDCQLRSISGPDVAEEAGLRPPHKTKACQDVGGEPGFLQLLCGSWPASNWHNGVLWKLRN